jgi:benzoyl-CoA 2,3-dioxygenase component B
MLTEEAHHMFVGESGVGRVAQRTCEIMREHKTDDVRRFGAIDLATVQKYLNFHCSVSLDLFGSEISTNAANYYTMSLKGRFHEADKTDDHRLKDAHYPVREWKGGEIRAADQPALLALNERLRDDFIADCERGVKRWNKIIRQAGVGAELYLPHRAFNRAIGNFAELRATPEGQPVTEAEWQARRHEWLPTPEDRAYVQSLMKPVVTPGRFANWIAPPSRGINGQPIDFEYVRLA